MNIGEVIGFVASVLAIVGIIGGFLWYIKSDIDKRLDKIDVDMKTFEDKFTSTNARIDRLYQMFVDLLQNQQKLKTDP